MPGTLAATLAVGATVTALTSFVGISTDTAVTTQYQPSRHRVLCCQDLRGMFTVDGARIRALPRPDATINGLGQRNHHVTLHCKTGTWLALTDDTTGIRGFSSTQVAAQADPTQPLTECTPPAPTRPSSTGQRAP